jgi:NADH:ubiquinone oxidoreductase subunit 6 (subunit J)
MREGIKKYWPRALAFGIAMTVAAFFKGGIRETAPMLAVILRLSGVFLVCAGVFLLCGAGLYCLEKKLKANGKK